MNALRRQLFVPFVLTAALAACGDDDVPPLSADAGSDASESDGGDVSTGDATGDASADAGDVGTDPSVDAPTDTNNDTGTDANDVQGDVPSDAASDVDAGPVDVRVRGTVSLTDAPLWLGLTVDGEPTEDLRVPEAGDYAFDTIVSEGATYTVEVLAMPRDWFCAIPEDDASGTAAREDAIVDVPCAEGRLVTVEQRDDAAQRYSRFDVEELESDLIKLGSLSIRDYGADGELFTDDDNAIGDDERYTRDGRHVRTVRTDGTPGPDGILFSDDDPVESYNTREYNENGDNIAHVRFSAPGPDAAWFTDDDVAESNSTWTARDYDDEGHLVCDVEIQFGPDGLRETDDDAFSRGTVYAYFEHPTIAGTAHRFHTVDGLGADGIPCTEDDVLAEPTYETVESADGLTSYGFTRGAATYQSYDEDADGRTARQVTWSPAGEGIGGPGVDTVVRYIHNNLEPTSAPDAIYYVGPGADSEWFTDDDEIGSVAPWFRQDAEGGALVQYYYNVGDDLHGPDGIWGTEDDNYDAVVRRERVGDDLACEVRISDGGADNLWQDTACGNADIDDDIQYVEWTRLDSEGRPTQSCRSNEPGPDGLWVTADDEASPSGLCSTFSYFEGGVSVRGSVLDPGPDGIAFTADDLPGERTVTALNEHGHQVFSAVIGMFDGPGADGAWVTADDDIAEFTTYVVDRAGTVLEESRGRPGDDGLLFTADDEVFYLRRWEVLAIPHAVYDAWD